MKIQLVEREQCFAVEFEAENLADAALLVRFGVGGTKEIRSRHVVARIEGKLEGCIVFGKSKKRVGDVR
jgi:hypothetical protein